MIHHTPSHSDHASLWLDADDDPAIYSMHVHHPEQQSVSQTAAPDPDQRQRNGWVDIDLYQAFPAPDAGDQITVTATLYHDTNDNGEFDPKIDQPYEGTGGDISATVTVPYGGDHP